MLTAAWTSWPGFYCRWICKLNPAQRQVMMLLFAQELKPSEAAKRLGCSVRNVTKHRLKALDKLRGLL